MKIFPAIVLIFSMLSSSCVVRPFVVPTKNGYIASAGGVLAARAKNTVAEVTTPDGAHIKFMSEEESGEDVPNTLLTTQGAVDLAGIQGSVTKHKATTDSATTLGLDKGRTARAGISAGTRAAEVFNPNLPIPVRR